MLALGAEYTKRYGKNHLTITKCRDLLYNLPKNIANTEFEQPPQCMPDEYRTDNSVDAYWNYYINEKANCCNLKNEQLHTTQPEKVS